MQGLAKFRFLLALRKFLQPGESHFCRTLYFGAKDREHSLIRTGFICKIESEGGWGSPSGSGSAKSS